MRGKIMSQDIKWSSVVKKAEGDAQFKSFLLDNPKAAIKQATDMELPADVEFFVHEQSPKQVHLVLPMTKSSYASTNGNGDGDKGIFVEPDDTSKGDGDKAIFVEPDDASKGDEKAIFVEPDDAGGDKAIFVEPDDASKSDDKAIFVEPDDAG